MYNASSLRCPSGGEYRKWPNIEAPEPMEWKTNSFGLCGCVVLLQWTNQSLTISISSCVEIPEASYLADAEVAYSILVITATSARRRTGE